MNKEIHIYASGSEFATAASERISRSILTSFETQGRCNLVFAGGNTPKKVYRQLAASFRSRIPWMDIQYFWGDERLVPPDHPDSNYFMVSESFLKHIEAIPVENVHRIRGEAQPEEAAMAYAKVISAVLPAFPPRFDLMLLGLGEDGHIASLFPDTEALRERKAAVTANFIPEFNDWRVTMTLPVLNNAREILFLVAGNSKAEVVKKVIDSEWSEPGLPAQLVRPENGSVHWILDSAAAALVDQR